MKNTSFRQSRAFTLMEMTIVLTIMGLVIAGVFAGRALIRQSQVASVVSDMQRYIAAAKSFQTQYNMLPGDFINATTYWGAAGGSAATGYTTDCYSSTTAYSTSTCNGNGDGKIAASATYQSEEYLFWQHLANAGMIQGQYTGQKGTAGTTDSVIGTNIPATRIDGAGLNAPLWQGYVGAGDANWFPGNYGHAMIFGSYSSNKSPVSAALTAAEAQSLDTKYDDGVPSSGNILTWVNSTGYTPNCATSAAAYNVTSTGLKCSMIFVTGF